jgi:hypothetical protein
LTIICYMVDIILGFHYQGINKMDKDSVAETGNKTNM